MSEDLAEGTRIGRYLVGAVISRGQTSVLYRARHEDTGHEVSLEVVAPSSAVLDAGLDPVLGVPFLARETSDGEALAARWAGEPRPGPSWSASGVPGSEAQQEGIDNLSVKPDPFARRHTRDERGRRRGAGAFESASGLEAPEPAGQAGGPGGVLRAFAISGALLGLLAVLFLSRASREAPTAQASRRSPAPIATIARAEDFASGTGFRARGPSTICVALDGRDLGPLPREEKDVTPGDHVVRFTSTDRYQPDERPISVKDGVLQDLGPVKLKVLKGKARLKLETPGASVHLVSGSDRKSIPTFPISIEFDTSRQWVIEATKAGFDDFKLPISFDDGEAEKSISIRLSEAGKPGP